MWEGSTRVYAPEDEATALDDALARARADRRVHDLFRRRDDEAVAAWRAAGGDAWVHGASGLWLKGVHHSAGPRWQVFRRREDWGSGRAAALGFVSHTAQGWVAIPLTGFPGPAHATSELAERALGAMAEAADDPRDAGPGR